MDERLKQILECSDIDEKYNLTIGYMEDEGITFRKLSDDHKNHHYRILEDGSSIFVYPDYFKLNLSEIDKQKLENEIDVEMKVLFKNKTQGIVDRVRPWTCSFPDVETLEKTVKIIAGRHMASSPGINVPVKPLGYDEENKVICPKCEYHFVNAERCPECGQKILYSDERAGISIDYSALLNELSVCETKRDLHAVMNKYGFRSHGQATETDNSSDLYFQFADKSRIHFQKNQMTLYTSKEYAEKYFGRYSNTFKDCSDGSYRTKKTRVDKNTDELEFLLSFFYQDKENRTGSVG